MVALTLVRVYYNELYALIAFIAILAITIVLTIICELKEDEYFDWSVFYVGALAYNFENIMMLLTDREVTTFLIIFVLNCLFAISLTFMIHWNKPGKKRLIREY
jgi:hypothetical protein